MAVPHIDNQLAVPHIDNQLNVWLFTSLISLHCTVMFRWITGISHYFSISLLYLCITIY
jgi:hypothetical protein